MKPEEIEYALKKQIGTAYAISTNYGDIRIGTLPTSAQERIQQAIRAELEREKEADSGK